MRVSGVLALGVVFLSLVGCTVEADRFNSVAHHIRQDGGLRTVRIAADARYTNSDLARNFDTIVFHVEPDINDGRHRLDILHRWQQPIRWRVISWGPNRDQERATVAETFDRLAELTGLDIAEAAGGHEENFLIYFLRSEDYEAASAGEPTWFREYLEEFRINPVSPCVARTWSGDGSEDLARGEIFWGDVLIRSGLTPLMRQSCVEEELAQALGPGNDDDRVRPSIFNDDEEFAFLTEHDAYLLRILYHARLQAGMPREEALGLIPDIVGELRPQGE